MPEPPSGNYLRVRGEYVLIDLSYERIEELPPRARRILAADQATRVADGTTSACAENTHRAAYHQENRRNYLRVRGEYSSHWGWLLLPWELPPRARRIP